MEISRIFFIYVTKIDKALQDVASIRTESHIILQSNYEDNALCCEQYNSSK